MKPLSWYWSSSEGDEHFKGNTLQYNMHTVACTAIAVQQVDKQLCYITRF